MNLQQSSRWFSCSLEVCQLIVAHVEQAKATHHSEYEQAQVREAQQAYCWQLTRDEGICSIALWFKRSSFKSWQSYNPTCERVEECGHAQANQAGSWTVQSKHNRGIGQSKHNGAGWGRASTMELGSVKQARWGRARGTIALTESLGPTVSRLCERDSLRKSCIRANSASGILVSWLLERIRAFKAVKLPTFLAEVRALLLNTRAFKAIHQSHECTGT